MREVCTETASAAVFPICRTASTGSRSVSPSDSSSQWKYSSSTDERLPRSEEHTSELQSLRHLVCRLLLEWERRVGYLPSFPTRRSSDLASTGSRSVSPSDSSSQWKYSSSTDERLP